METQEETAAYYGALAKVAIRFYVATGNTGELTAAYWYTRYAVRAALEGPCPCGCGSRQHHQDW